MYRKLRVALAQAASEMGNTKANGDKLERWVREAAGKGANMIVFPELFYSGYYIDKETTEACAISTDDPFFDRVKKLAVECEINILFSYPEKNEQGGMPYISLAFIDAEGKLVSNHRKTYLWLDEVKRVTRAEADFDVIETPFGKIGTLICYEAEFPEPARIMTLRGAEIIIMASVMETIPNMHRYMSAMGILNQVYAIGVNGVRPEAEPRGGGGCVADQNGKMICCLPEGEEQLEIVEIDLGNGNRRDDEPHREDFDPNTVQQLVELIEWK